MMSTTILIVGGREDPSIRALVEGATTRGWQVSQAVIDEGAEPGFSWDLETDDVKLDGRRIDVHAAFLRYDVFGRRQASGDLDRAAGWYASVFGWCLARPEVRLLNRGLDVRTSSKPFMLTSARRHGLRVPRTIVTNELPSVHRAAAEGAAWVSKPVAGGGYCTELEASMSDVAWRDGLAPMPALLQERLTYPEFRVYLVGERALVFRIQSERLDYRCEPRTQMTFEPVDALPPHDLDGLRNLARAMRLDFCAADLKTDRETGELRFLEVNSSPMFAAHERVSNGAVTGAMLDWLEATQPE